ncbi:MAG TPA: hypothetical protein VIL20_06460 [Sandaracinaceae bacterium]
MRWAFVALVALVACSSPSPRTQVVVEIDADGYVRGMTDHLAVEVTGLPGGQTEALELNEWPAYVSLVPRDNDASRRYELSIRAVRDDGSTAVHRRVRSGYVAGRTLALRVRLTASCAGATCVAEDETCIDGDCQPLEIEPADLPEWAEAGADAGAGMDAGHDGGTDGGRSRDGGVPVEAFYRPCHSDGACPDGWRCVNDIYRRGGGYCSPPCVNSLACRALHPDGTCGILYPVDACYVTCGAGCPAGATCDTERGICVGTTGVRLTYSSCETTADCPPETHCEPLASGNWACTTYCETDADCPAVDIRGVVLTGSCVGGECLQDCATNESCAPGLTCMELHCQ